MLVALLAVLPRIGAADATAPIAVATENPIATQEAIAALRAGGNAVDAAVTAALVAGVASPSSSGLGGGGFAVVWMASQAKATALDFRETAPAGVDVGAFDRRPLADAERGKLVGVPGELAGLAALHRKFGKLAWSKVVAPAERWARTGYPVGEHLAQMLGTYQKQIQIDAAIAGLFYPKGRPAAVGQRVVNPRLGRTLARVAREGADAVYKGSIAADLVRAAASAGGGLSSADLQNYQPVEHDPLVVHWEGTTLYTMPPPSAGGLMLAETLGMLSRADLARLGFGSAAYDHLLAEVFRGAISDRMRSLGDPAFVPPHLERLLAPARLAARRSKIGLDRTHAMPRFDLDEHGTHALCVADAAGNMVSLTTTVNRLFGAKITASESGVVLNDQLDDFTAAKSVAAFGLRESPNRARPGARPISSMTPVIAVRDGAARYALGGSGGMAIAGNVTQVLLGLLAFDQPPDRAVAAPRIFTPAEGALIELEPSAAPLRADLERRGEIVRVKATFNAVQVVANGGATKQAAADPRKHGSAIVQ